MMTHSRKKGSRFARGLVWLGWIFLLPLVRAQTSLPPGEPGIEVVDQSSVEFRQATDLYQQKKWADALTAFSLALPGLRDSYKEEALYRIGDCYRFLGKGSDALGVYGLALKSYPTSVFTNITEFYVGQIWFQTGQYEKALEYFGLVQDKGDPATKEAVSFYTALCSMRLKRPLDALPLLREYADKPGPFAVAAAQALAMYDQQSSNWPESLKYWKQVLSQSTETALLSQAAAQAGWVALQSGDAAQSESLFARCRQIDPKSEWNKLANSGLLEIYFQQARYKDVVDCYNKNRDTFLLSGQAEILLYVARSYFRLNDPINSVQTYDVFLAQCKDHPAAPAAAYERLLARQQINPDNVGGDAVAFLAAYPKSEYIPYVSYLRAYDFSRRKQFDEARPMWAELWKNPPPNIPPETILLELIRAHVETKNWSDAAQACDLFIQKFPESKSLLSCRVNRAVSWQNLGNIPVALTSWKEVRNHAPAGSAEQQMACEQIIVLLSQPNSNGDDLVAACRDLLKLFPKSNLKGLATYTIGSAAFDKKNYDEAEPFLQNAHDLAEKTWLGPATYRLAWIAYTRKQLEKTEKLVAEYDKNTENDPKSPRLPAAFYYWLGLQKAEKNQLNEASVYLNQTLNHPEVGSLKSSAWWELGEVSRRMKDWKTALQCYGYYCGLDPKMATSTVVLLAQIESNIGAGVYPLAKEQIDKVLLQEPEGPRNAQARLLLAQWHAAQLNYVDAAKSYATLALIYQDNEITPQAMEGAYEMWEKAGDPIQATSWHLKLNEQFPNYKVRTK